MAIEAYDTENAKVDGVYSSTNLPNALYDKVKDYLNPTTDYLNYSSWLSNNDKSTAINNATTKIKEWFNTYEVAAVSRTYTNYIQLITEYRKANANPSTHAVQYQNVETTADDLEEATTVDALEAAMDKITKTLTLLPKYPSYPSDTYQSVTLSRTLKAGYNSLALPFDTNVATLTGRTANEGDWVAQLETVTYNKEDGYTLYFQKGNGNIAANQPYVLHLADKVDKPTWAGQTVGEPSSNSVSATNGYDGHAGWAMCSNFTAGMSMAGKYGVVNSEDGLKVGGATSTLNAFAAYIAPPAGVQNVRVQSAYIDWDGTIDYVGSAPTDAPTTRAALYDLTGRRIQQPVRGLNIIRRADGTVRKVLIKK